MKVKDIMTPNTQVINPNTTVWEAAKLMRDFDIGFLPVEQNDKLVGSVTDRDITIRVVAEGLDLKSTPVSKILSKKVWFCFEDQDAGEVVHSMAEQLVHRFPVMNQDKRLVGVISLGDIAAKGHETTEVGKALEQICSAA